MSVKILVKYAEELEKILSSKIGDNVKVGWMKDTSGNSIFIVYGPGGCEPRVPDKWYGYKVVIQAPRIDDNPMGFMLYSSQLGQ